MSKINKTIFGYPCQGTEKQLAEMYNLLNFEDYTTTKFGKYFYRWINGDNTGLRWFPRPEYCSLKGDNYAIALIAESGNHQPYRSQYAKQYYVGGKRK